MTVTQAPPPGSSLSVLCNNFPRALEAFSGRLLRNGTTGELDPNEGVLLQPLLHPESDRRVGSYRIWERRKHRYKKGRRDSVTGPDICPALWLSGGQCAERFGGGRPGRYRFAEEDTEARRHASLAQGGKGSV